MPVDNLDRRSFVGAVAATGMLVKSGLARAATPPSARLPNIVFIMADDLGYADLGCTGSRHTATPNIDSLAANGLLMRQGYANSCICSPTRTGLLTGCYQQRFAIGLQEPLGPGAPKDSGVPFGRRTIASVLRDRGYATALVGKWHLGDPPAHGPLAYGYDHFFGVAEGAADYYRHKIVIGGKDIGTGLFKDNEEIARTGYLTDILGDEAVRLIAETRDKPLFLSLHFNAPHWPWEGREDAEVSRTLKDIFHYDGGSLKTYSNMVAAMDDNVGKVLAALKARGILDDTIVVFTSDNGGERFSDTWPFTGVKGELLEGGLRVPIAMQWPGRIKARDTSEQTMISMDFLPTFLAIAGGKARPNEFDGMDLSQHLLGKAPLVERTLYWRYRANRQAAVRQGNWKYLSLGGKEHLFDLNADERERADLAPDEPGRLADMRELWNAWNRQMLPYPPKSYSEDVREHYPDRY